MIQLQFGVTAPNNFPRTDLIAAFLTGIDGVNQVAAGSNMNAVPSEMLRLNTAIPAVGAGTQNDLGPLGGDNAGFPNGRRPGDDVVDVALRATMGVLCYSPFAANVNCADGNSNSTDDQVRADAQLNSTRAYTDGTAKPATEFMTSFPYLNTPFAGE